ncbi:hypothetical protein FA15DRAFT_297766 [Coprinopsis marcescibilis]|uniref:Uncharacterized protein n=1 Tax=Coprinopsis marcescibilis TaxID=230819 RepID=A0A5C3KCU3_COPMA|nr:hypothetical protein FA15DRAFT_297766 [Coprinopsis marcescibilis]
MRDFFSGNLRELATYKIDLNEDYEIEPDMEIFLRASFATICERSRIRDEWTSEVDILKLEGTLQILTPPEATLLSLSPDVF